MTDPDHDLESALAGLRNLKTIRGSVNGGVAIYLCSNPVLAAGLPFPALTCKAGRVYPGGLSDPNNAYVNSFLTVLNAIPSC